MEVEDGLAGLCIFLLDDEGAEEFAVVVAEGEVGAGEEVTLEEFLFGED
mgnify:CR=1 FL=1